MYIPLQPILSKYNIQPKGVVHCGSHFAEEHDEYVKCGIERFVYIEPCRNAYDVICQKFGWGCTPDELRSKACNQQKDNILICNVACGAEEKEMPMYVSHQNQGQSNSFLEPYLHLEYHPDIIFDDVEVVKMVTLDSIPIQKENYNILVMDVEGYESEVIKGASETLKHIDLIYSEVQRAETRRGNMLIDDFDKLLDEKGFTRVETYWPSENWGWGDAILLSKKILL